MLFVAMWLLLPVGLSLTRVALLQFTFEFSMAPLASTACQKPCAPLTRMQTRCILCSKTKDKVIGIRVAMSSACYFLLFPGGDAAAAAAAAA